MQELAIADLQNLGQHDHFSRACHTLHLLDPAVLCAGYVNTQGRSPRPSLLLTKPQRDPPRSYRRTHLPHPGVLNVTAFFRQVAATLRQHGNVSGRAVGRIVGEELAPRSFNAITAETTATVTTSADSCGRPRLSAVSLRLVSDIELGSQGRPEPMSLHLPQAVLAGSYRQID